jgi:hypothetical protein
MENANNQMNPFYSQDGKTATPYIPYQRNMDWMECNSGSPQRVNIAPNDNSNYVNLLNSISKMESKKISELVIDKKYKVKSFKKVTTQFGQRTIVVLEDESNKSFDVFLPERYNALQANYNVSGISLIYQGLTTTTKGSKYPNIEFCNN